MNTNCFHTDFWQLNRHSCRSIQSQAVDEPRLQMRRVCALNIALRFHTPSVMKRPSADQVRLSVTDRSASIIQGAREDTGGSLGMLSSPGSTARAHLKLGDK